MGKNPETLLIAPTKIVFLQPNYQESIEFLNSQYKNGEASKNIFIEFRFRSLMFSVTDLRLEFGEIRSGSVWYWTETKE